VPLDLLSLNVKLKFTAVKDNKSQTMKYMYFLSKRMSLQMFKLFENSHTISKRLQEANSSSSYNCSWMVCNESKYLLRSIYENVQLLLNDNNDLFVQVLIQMRTLCWSYLEPRKQVIKITKVLCFYHAKERVVNALWPQNKVNAMKIFFEVIRMCSQ